MKLTMANMKLGFGKLKLKAVKYSPEMLVGAGIAGMIAGAVMACKATIKAKDILDESRETIKKIHEVANDKQYEDSYTEEDKKKDLATVRLQTGIKLAKTYAPAVLVGVAGVAGVLSGHHLLHMRLASLAAAYTALDESFKGYRKRVAEKLGEEAEDQLKHGVKAEEKAAEGKKKREPVLGNPADGDPYTAFFGPMCFSFEKGNPSANLKFLQDQQSFLNRKLQSQGFLFLNDVLRTLDLPMTRAGQIVGWVYDPERPDIDCYIDFGLGRKDEMVKRFRQGLEDGVWLEFNCDGPILEILPGGRNHAA